MHVTHLMHSKTDIEEQCQINFFRHLKTKRAAGGSYTEPHADPILYCTSGITPHQWTSQSNSVSTTLIRSPVAIGT